VKVAANATNYTWTDLSPGTYKCFHVRTINQRGSSTWTDWACATTPTSGDILLIDTFDDPVKGKLQSSANSTDYRIGYERGEYFLNQTTTNATSRGLHAFVGAYPDAVMTVKARIIGESDWRYIAVGCRTPNTYSSTTSGYLFQLNALGTVRLSRLDDGIPTTLVSDTSWPTIHPITEWNLLEINCVGNGITARINGATVASARDDTYKDGYMYIMAGVFSNVIVTGPTQTGVPLPNLTFEARFDDLIVIQR
jgi:hypothetical protein